MFLGSSLATIVPLLLLVSGGPDPETANLWRNESSRVQEMVRLVTKGKPPAEAPPPANPGESTCPTNAARRIEVATAAALESALAKTKPGDHIHMADGIYPGRFVAAVSGTARNPITLCGSRAAVIDGGNIKKGYGFHLTADHWILTGFTIRNARKGIMIDDAHRNVLRGLEVVKIGEEGIHFRKHSTHNLLELSWIHDVGRYTPKYGEGVYIGSAPSNWRKYTDGEPDASNHNRIVSNLIGPHVAAECVDAKEGSRRGAIIGNIFISQGKSVANSWIDLKGNLYEVRDNVGIHGRDPSFQSAEVHAKNGYGEDHIVRDNVEHRTAARIKPPFRAASQLDGAVSIVLPGRDMPYTIRELLIRYPESFERMRDGAVLVREHIVAAQGAKLVVDARDVRELRLLSRADGFVTITGYKGGLEFDGTEQSRLAIRSWDPAAKGPDQNLADGRACVFVRGGRMDVSHVDATDLGFGTGMTSGMAWKGLADEKSAGRAQHSRFEHNFIGAYAFEADGMQWIGNVFANNVGYGFDARDHSDHSLIEGNSAHGNGRHGFILSRGCRANILRDNKSFDNGWNGIVIDDGKVIDDDDPRHARAMPSNENLIEHCEVWNNQIGIVIEGGQGNIVRDNMIRDNGHGIQLRNAAVASRIATNSIRGSKALAIHVTGRSNRNRIVGNHIRGGQDGIVVENSADNVIEDNTFKDVRGRHIVP